MTSGSLHLHQAAPLAMVLAVTPGPATSSVRVRVNESPPPLPAAYGETPMATPLVVAFAEIVLIGTAALVR